MSTQPWNLEEAIVFYKDGKGLRYIAKFFGLHKRAVSQRLKIAGVKVSNPCSRAFDNYEEKEIIREYLLGLNTYKLANKYKVTPPTIRSVLDRNKIQRRGRHKYRCNNVAFDLSQSDSGKTSEVLYWVGLLMADGNVSKNAVSLCLKASDIQHVNAFRIFLQSDAPLRARKTTCRGKEFSSVTLQVFSKCLVASLARYGVVPRKSLIAKASGGVELQRAFWRGLIDGDGSLGIYKQSDCDYFSPKIYLCGTNALMTQFADYIYTNLHFRQTICHIRSICCVRCSGKKAVRLVEHFYGQGEISLERKQIIANEIMARFPIERYDRDNNWDAITWQDSTKTLVDWAIVLGIPYETLRQRLARGLSIEKAFTLPDFRKFVTWQGETRTLKEWATILNVPYTTLHGRLQRGCTVDEAFVCSGQYKYKKRLNRTF